jgi:lysophospholipase L1-like esterase
MKIPRSLIIIVLVLVSFVSRAQDTIRVACVGNSITEGAAIESGKKYPEQLQTLLGNKYAVKNFGLGGRTLLKKGDFPYWNEAMYKEVLSWNPDIVIIKLGTNDSKPQNWQFKDQFESDYREFIQSFKKLPGKRKIYICTPIPVFKDAWGISEVVVRDEIVPMVKNIAKAEKVKLIDLYTPMTGNSGMVPDGVHPDANGAGVIAQTIYKAIHQDRF